MLTFLTYFVLVINGDRINRFHLFWDTLVSCDFVAFGVRQSYCKTSFRETVGYGQNMPVSSRGW